ncbi:hypothetical protein GP2143_11774 [marine gamma proteobacterium HTCC2143]|uniref:Uncharacterized protein n=1 Tax=marine gamma proteobacterium HTCC2143 TaxID=247633 RepID=A0YH01_9GAMM|nr:hypothetical protein GP2143_11774 [marine gamma proteobacterium HTCC2143]
MLAVSDGSRIKDITNLDNVVEMIKIYTAFDTNKVAVS